MVLLLFGKAPQTPLPPPSTQEITFLSPKLYSCGTFTARMGVTSWWGGQLGSAGTSTHHALFTGKAQCLYQLTAWLLHGQSPLSIAPRKAAAGAYPSGDPFSKGDREVTGWGRPFQETTEWGTEESSYILLSPTVVQGLWEEQATDLKQQTSCCHVPLWGGGGCQFSKRTEILVNL